MDEALEATSALLACAAAVVQVHPVLENPADLRIRDLRFSELVLLGVAAALAPGAGPRARAADQSCRILGSSALCGALALMSVGDRSVSASRLASLVLGLLALVAAATLQIARGPRKNQGARILRWTGVLISVLPFGLAVGAASLSQHPAAPAACAALLLACAASRALVPTCEPILAFLATCGLTATCAANASEHGPATVSGALLWASLAFAQMFNVLL